MTRLEALRYIKQEYGRAGIGDAEAESRNMLADILDVNISDLFVFGQTELCTDAAQKVKSAVSRRIAGEPLAYITGRRYFMGFCFAVDERVLIPRQDTELLCESAVELLKSGGRMLDICTGSGCVAISVAKLTDANVTASDISKGALSVAKMNAQALGADVRFINADLFDGIDGAYDVITANPPYIDSAQMALLGEDVKREPKGALFGGDDGLDFYRRIIPEAKKLLLSGGTLLLEIGFDQSAAVSGLMEQEGYINIVIKRDMAGKTRVVQGEKADV